MLNSRSKSDIGERAAYGACISAPRNLQDIEGDVMVLRARETNDENRLLNFSRLIFIIVPAAVVVIISLSHKRSKVVHPIASN